jgi:hypothetical protein
MKAFSKPGRRAKSAARRPSTPAAGDEKQPAEAYEAPPPPPSPPTDGPLDLQKPEHARWWLHAVREAIADVVCVAREGTRRLKHRVLSRAELRRQLRQTETSLDELIGKAEEALLR